MRTTTKALAAGAALALLLAGCSDGDDEGTSSTTDDTAGGGAELDDPAAAARTAAVAYFEAYAVLDLPAARDVSADAAELVVDWAGAVDAIDDVDGTPYAVTPAPSVEVTVAISDVAEAGDGAWAADGYLQLENHPPGLVPGEVPADEQTDPPSWFVTDLTFAEEGDGLVVTDYRMDDAEYPVSALFTSYDDLTAAGEGQADADDTASDDGDGATDAAVELVLGRRALDGSVQHLLDVGDGTTVTEAAFVETDGRGGDEVGEPVPVELFAGGSDDGADVLVVRPGAFPGEVPGVLRLTVEGDDGTTDEVDLEVPPFENVPPEQTNTVRAAEVDPSTTSTSPSSTTTSTTEASSSTTTVDDDTTSTTSTTEPPPSSSSSTSSSSSSLP